VFEYFEGTVASKSASRLVLDVGGTGYDFLIPLGSAFPADERLRVWCHLAVREDAHTLYGFADKRTRDLYRLLLKVRGVGPGMALGILSGLSRAELTTAIQDEDMAALLNIKGVGKKTAEQILLDLRDKIGDYAGGPGFVDAPVSSTPNPADANVLDAVAALASVGYTEREAKKLVEKASQTVNPQDLELLVRTALKS
jgi:Holliday junction DNA helicase RuvA